MAEPRNPLIHPTPEEKAKLWEELREEELLELLRFVFDLARAKWGEEEGRKRWRKITHRRGHKRGSTRPMEDRQLLNLYDHLVATGEDTKHVPRIISKFVKDNPHPSVSSAANVTEEAINKRLRRQLKARRENPLNWPSRDK